MRVAVFTNLSEIAQTVATALRRLGHEPVGVVAAVLERPDPRLRNIDGPGSVPGELAVTCAGPAEVSEAVKAMRPDLILSWAYPRRIPEDVTSSVVHGGINFHPSLLPRHRGPNPVGWTLRSADDAYGATWHRLVAAFDAGGVLARASFPVAPEDTVGGVNLRLSAAALRMLHPVLDLITAGDPGQPQDELRATYAPPFGDDYATLDLSRPVDEVHRQVRAWAFAAGTGSADGPFVTLDGIAYRVTDSALRRTAGARLVACADGPLWLSGLRRVSGGETDRPAGRGPRLRSSGPS